MSLRTTRFISRSRKTESNRGVVMSTLAGRHIAIGISGGIAAYKSLSLIRLFKSAGCDVRVAATRHALEFVTPLSIETLSQNKLYSDVFASAEHHDAQHISLAEWADCLVVAPATANIIGKYACGIADDALSTLMLAMRKPIFVAPAMNNMMLTDASVQANLERLRQKGTYIIGPETGFLACGNVGDGRMTEPENIFTVVQEFYNHSTIFSGKKILVTAGPTCEAIDPVRFVGNFSSGLMGFSLAEAAAEQGADVTLITGPTHLLTSDAHIRRIDVVAAHEMYEQCMAIAQQQDIFILAAAVADYTPEQPAREKIKKSAGRIVLPLVKTEDILAAVGKQKRKDQFVAGFALESENEIDNARRKLKMKNADIIVLNSLRDSGAGFRSKTNRVTILSNDRPAWQSELKDKKAIACDILNFIHKILCHE